jgi:hypothetical protein
MEKNCDGAVHIMTYRVSKKTHGVASRDFSQWSLPIGVYRKKNGYVIHEKAFANRFGPRQNGLR